MQIPVEVSFKDTPVSDAVEAAALRHAAALEKFYGRITSCRVVIEAPHRHHHRKGALYTVRVDLTVPGREIVVNREHRLDHGHEDVFVAMRDAFDAARRRLEDHVRRMRGQVKVHAEPPIGRVVRLYPDEDYGFIETTEGGEVYFHRHALIEGKLDHLRIDDLVRFVEERGEKGPQAASVWPVHPHAKRSGEQETRP